MRKLFKNSKQILSFVLAFAVLSVSLFTGVALKVEAAPVTDTIYWDGTKDSVLADDGETGTADDPIIIDNASELWYLVTDATADATKDKFFKVKDGIKNIILQPESVIGTSANITGIADAEAAKTYLQGLSGKKEWNSAGNGQFNGVFDGNGATIYGLYTSQGGFFYNVGGGTATNPTTFKNFTIKNSYYSSGWRMGAIMAYPTGTAGQMNIDNVAIINNYFTNSDGMANKSLLTGANSSHLSSVNNVLVYGNKLATSGLLPAISAASVNLSGQGKYHTITNSVILGVKVHDGRAQYAYSTVNSYENVYTDVDFETGNTSASFQYADTDIKAITAEGAKGAAGKEAMPGLDWANVWLANDGLPELRSFHNLSMKDTAMKHYEECADCGLKGVEFSHTYANVAGDYICTVCTHKCLHDGAHGMTSVPTDGDCVTAAGTYVTCPCGYTNNMVTGAAPTGHVLQHHPANDGHCQEDAIAEHWTCETCGKIFLTEDEMAPMGDAVEKDDPSYNLGLGTHKKETDADGFVIYNDKTGHWYRCFVCDGRLDEDGNKMEDTETQKHNFKNGMCEDCGWHCNKGEHEFYKTGIILEEGDCTTDRQEQVKCVVCGITGHTVTKEAAHTIVKTARVEPTDKLEGTKEHYSCSVCKEIYADAEGKTPITKASIVIPKTINADGMSNVVPGEGTGTNGGVGTSPATADNIILSVAAIAALAGAAFVLIRKAKKA